MTELIDPWATHIEAPWMHQAAMMLGVKEIPGAKHNPAIVQLWRDIGRWVRDDETAYCAAGVGACLERSGYAHTGRGNARSYLDHGTACDPTYGAIAVFWRGSVDSWKGHVAFWLRADGARVWVLGFNQGNTVSAAPYPRARLLGTRWPEPQ